MDFMFVAVILFFGLSILAYALVAIFYPELVGITGKKAREIEASHRTESEQQKKD